MKKHLVAIAAAMLLSLPAHAADNLKIGFVTTLSGPAGIIGKLTEVLMCKALDAARTWPDHIRLSVNLSTRDVVSNKTVDALLDIIAESGIDPARLDIEVTETAVMR